MKPLNEGMFNTIVSMQKQGKANNEVQDAMQFFGMASAADFEIMRQTVSQVMPEMVTEHGTWGAQLGPLHGCPMTWPSLFVHACEAKQLLNRFGQQLCRALLATRWYMPMEALKAVVDQDQQPEGESSQLCFCVRLVQRQMAVERRYKIKMPPRLTTKNAAGTKRRPATAPDDTPNSKSSKVDGPQPSNKADSPQHRAILPMPSGEEGTSHSPFGNTPPFTGFTSTGSSTDQSALANHAAPPALPCDCSGNCAGGKPCCPSRRRWSTAKRNGRCPNPAEKIDNDAVRHFCKACRCQAEGCSWPRRRGFFCAKHAEQQTDTAVAHGQPVGWYAIKDLQITLRPDRSRQVNWDCQGNSQMPAR